MTDIEMIFLNRDPTPEMLIRGWAKAYRETPEHRFPSDPNAEFFPVDLEAAADEINRLEGEAWKYLQECGAQARRSDALVAVLQEAVGLYETYGLCASTTNAGAWVNRARDVLASVGGASQRGADVDK